MPLCSSIYTRWSKPLAEAVASRLLEGRRGMPVDMGSHRVIVPSSFASRLIHEELAKQAPNGVLLPEFQTPDKFLNWGDHAEEAQRLGSSEAQDKPRGPVASKLSCVPSPKYMLRMMRKKSS